MIFTRINMFWIYLIFVGILLFIVLSILFWTLRNGISPMPSSRKATQTILSLIPPGNRTIYELGSGWGNLAYAIAKQYPDRRVIGYETSLVPYWIARLLFRRGNLRFERKNFFSKNLRDAGLIVCYLYPGAMRQLKEKFQKELLPGTQILSNTFALPGWEPQHIVEVDDLYKTKIYRYEI